MAYNFNSAGGSTTLSADTDLITTSLTVTNSNSVLITVSINLVEQSTNNISVHWGIRRDSTDLAMTSNSFHSSGWNEVMSSFTFVDDNPGNGTYDYKLRIGSIVSGAVAKANLHTIFVQEI